MRVFRGAITFTGRAVPNASDCSPLASKAHGPDVTSLSDHSKCWLPVTVTRKRGARDPALSTDPAATRATATPADKQARPRFTASSLTYRRPEELARANFCPARLALDRERRREARVAR